MMILSALPIKNAIGRAPSFFGKNLPAPAIFIRVFIRGFTAWGMKRLLLKKTWREAFANCTKKYRKRWKKKIIFLNFLNILTDCWKQSLKKKSKFYLLFAKKKH